MEGGMVWPVNTIDFGFGVQVGTVCPINIRDTMFWMGAQVGNVCLVNTMGLSPPMLRLLSSKP